jgi:hypothetical protein
MTLPGQLPLDFERGYPDTPGHRGGDTQIAAAKKIEEHLGRLQKIVLEHIAACGDHGATREEIANTLRLPNGELIKLQTVCARVRELELLGHIIATDERRDGRKVMKITPWRADEFK